MPDKIDPIPTGPRAITAYLTIKGAAKGIEFYKKAFGAKELMRWTGKDGRVGHAEIEISGTPVFISDEHPEMGIVSPETLHGTCVGLHLLVEDADATFKRAVCSGRKSNQADGGRAVGAEVGNLAGPVRSSMVRHTAHSRTVGGRDGQNRQVGRISERYLTCA